MKDFTLHIDLNNVQPEKEQAKEQLKKFSDSSTPENKSRDRQFFKDTVAGVGTVMAAKQIVSIGTDIVDYRLSTVGARYGDTARQNQINNFMTQMNIAGGIASSTISGGVAGFTVGGPIGAAVGAAVMATASIVGEVVQGIQRSQDWEREQIKNNLEEVRTSERLGLMKTDRNRK